MSVLAEGMSRPRLDDRGRQQHVILPVVEGVHHLVELAGCHLAVGARHFQLGHVLLEKRRRIVEVRDARHHIECLAAAVALPQQCLAQDHGVERRHIGAHRQAIDRRRRDQRHLAHARQRELQRARDGRGGQRQDVHVLAELLQPLLVLHAEMLLLVHDQEPEIGELDALGEQRMGADDDVDVARRDALLHLGALLGAHQARGLRDLHGEAAEALGEGVVMLAREQRGRHHHGDLLAGQHGDQACPERHLGLAEADIAADQAVHGAAAGEIVEHRADRGRLVVGLLVREARRELVIDAVGRVQHRRLAELAQRRDLDQLLGHVADALLQPGLTRLPADAAQPVELHARTRRSRSG